MPVSAGKTSAIGASTQTGYGLGFSAQRKFDRTSNGVLWVTWWDGTYNAVSSMRFSYSTDNGVTWTEASAFGFAGTNSGYHPNGSFYIDIDDYAHVAYMDGHDGHIKYRRGTPNATRTAWTWSSALTIAAGSGFYNYPDLVAHREGTGWAVHFAISYSNINTAGANDGEVYYWRVGVAADGAQTITLNGSNVSNFVHSLGNFAVASVDFHHTGDGKTVKDGTPHVFFGLSVGATGTNLGVKARRAAYSAGSWTLGTILSVNDNYSAVGGNATYWQNARWDGTRFVIIGVFPDLVMWDIDVGVTAATARVLQLADSNANRIFSGSAAWDSSGNIYVLGRDDSGGSGTRKLHYRLWTRSSAALGPIVALDYTVPDNTLAVSRREIGSRLEFIYMDSGHIKFSYNGDFVEPLVVSASATDATYSPTQRKTDRTSNGVLWAAVKNSDNGGVLDTWHCHYSLDNGQTWTDSGSHVNASGTGAGATTTSLSFFIDADDYAHVVYKDRNNFWAYYRRGTPNAARTAWTWSGEVLVQQSSTADFPDVIAHREGTGWVAHVIISSNTNDSGKAYYCRVTITSAGAISVTPIEQISAGLSAANNIPGYASIDFHHTGDGKTVKSGTPHIYVSWTAGSMGAARGVRFRKAVYASGGWTWNAEREIDTGHAQMNVKEWLLCLFDGTRVMLVGQMSAVAGVDVMLYERDEADTTTTTTTLHTDVASTANAANALFSGSAAYDLAGNLHLFGADFTGGNGTRKLNRRTWNRAAAAMGPIVTLDDRGPDFPYFSSSRGPRSGRLYWVYCDIPAPQVGGATSPVPVIPGSLELPSAGNRMIV